MTEPQPVEVLHDWTDQRLLEAWDDSYREPGNPEADALCAEIERRNLEF